jgi:hypothetical protein
MMRNTGLNTLSCEKAKGISPNIAPSPATATASPGPFDRSHEPDCGVCVVDSTMLMRKTVPYHAALSAQGKGEKWK